MIRNKERGVNFIIQKKREQEIKEICDNFFFRGASIQLIDTMVINFVLSPLSTLDPFFVFFYILEFNSEHFYCHPWLLCCVALHFI